MQTALIVFGLLNIVYNVAGINGISSLPVDETLKRNSYITGLLFLGINIAALLCAIFINTVG